MKYIATKKNGQESSIFFKWLILFQERYINLIFYKSISQNLQKFVNSLNFVRFNYRTPKRQQIAKSRLPHG